jgi:hypothetical protein
MSELIKELPAVARNINLPCKKCGVERFHVVVAHTSATSAKVKCEVCGASKTFKLTTPKTSSPRKVTTKGPKKPDSASLWAELRSQIGTDKLMPYNMKAKFPIAAAIEHPKFGVGFVTAVTNEKIDVAFEECGRSLVHNRP